MELEASRVYAEQVEHHVSITKFKEDMLKIIQAQEDKLRGLSIEYDEELYPHLMSTIAERRFLFLSLFIITLSPCF